MLEGDGPAACTDVFSNPISECGAHALTPNRHKSIDSLIRSFQETREDALETKLWEQRALIGPVSTSHNIMARFSMLLALACALLVAHTAVAADGKEGKNETEHLATLKAHCNYTCVAPPPMHEAP